MDARGRRFDDAYARELAQACEPYVLRDLE
jgi:hypothetical protein